MILTAVCIVSTFNLFSQGDQPAACCMVNNFYFTYSTAISGSNIAVSFNPVFSTPDISCSRKFGSISSLSWDFGGGATSSSTNPTHNYTLNTSCVNSVYTVTVNFIFTASDGTHNSCSYTQTIFIQNPNTVSTNTITASVVNCKTYYLTYNGPVIPNAQWSFGDGTYSPVITDGSQSFTHTFPTAGTYVVTLTGDGIAPCFIVKQVVVSDFVVADFTYSSGTPCNLSGGLDVNILNYNSSLYSYNWIINSSSVPSSGLSQHMSTGLVAGANTIKLTITENSTGCVTSVSKIVYIGSPSASFSTFSNTLCSGDMLSVSGLSLGADQYLWTITKPDLTTTYLLGMNPMYVFNPSNLASLAGTYTIALNTNTYYQDPLNPANTLTCTNTSQQLVTVNSIPSSHFSFASSSCAGSISLNLPTTTFTSYTLSYGDGTASMTGGGTYASGINHHTYSLNGIYTVSLTLNNGSCHSSYGLNTNINAIPVLSIHATAANICPGSNTTLTALLSAIPAGAGTISYFWTGPGTFTSSATSITVANAGTYNLNVTSGGVCSINLNKSQSIYVVTAPSVNVTAAAFLNCSQATASATLDIPVGLLNDGYCINGNCVSSNTLATSSQTTQVNNLVEGDNYVTITNALNSSCSVVKLIHVDRAHPSIVLNVTQPTNCLASTGGAASVGTIPSTTFKWYKLADYYTGSTLYSTSTSTSNLPAGSYVVEAANGYCVSQSYFNIITPVISASTPNSILATCAGNTTSVTINETSSPATLPGPYNYTWQQINTSGTTTLSTGSSNIQNLAPGNYIVHITANNCALDYDFTINEYEPLQVAFESNSPNCKFQGQIDAAVSGGDGSYNYHWVINGTPSTSVTPSLNLGNFTVSTVVTLTVTDLSGCKVISNPQTITPAIPVTLIDCGVPTATGTANATVITPCDIHACVTGGVAPYNFEWYKVGNGTKTVEWTFSDISGQFIASNGTNTFVITNHPASSSTVDIATCKLLNVDQDPTTVCYPTWNFTGTPFPVPTGTIAVTMGSGASSYTVAKNVYYTVVETTTLAAQESFVASASGVVPTATASTEDFTTGDYNLHVTDANGCSYTFSLGTLTFVEPSTFSISFDYVWGMNINDVAEPTEEQTEDVVLAENMIEAANALSEEANKCMEQKTKELTESLKTNCLDLSGYKDNFSMSYILKEHHYTLYYYDRAGQLTKTVPPEGVHYLSNAEITNELNYRQNAIGAAVIPSHSLTTTYHYNSFGQLITQNTPDGGASKFIYDSKNRLRFSQNAKQKTAAVPVYSYTKYDELGRIIEVGESKLSGSTLSFATPTLTTNTAVADNTITPINSLSSPNKQVTHTIYSDQTAETYYGQPQRFLQNRVSYTYIDEDPNASGGEQYTYYSYDSHGNVEWLIQNNSTGIGKNYIRYEYDLVSGKVLKVAYNENRLDRFYHKYLYDSENRLTKTLTSRDGELWDEDASYQYYAHGPLKRNVIGEDHVQGLDYIYTIQGWLKSINTPHLSGTDDPGKDNGNPLTASTAGVYSTTKVAADRNGMMLNYFTGDYLTSGTNNFINNSTTYSLANLLTSSTYTANKQDLFNGNISSWSQSQIDLTTHAPIVARADMYQYDALNRIRNSFSLNQSAPNSTAWSALSGGANTFKSEYTYDANGNILNLKRFDDLGNQMDDIGYTYSVNTANGDLINNKLVSVNDAITTFTVGRGDIEGIHNYAYDSIGNLIHESGVERLNLTGTHALYIVNTDIKWTVYGKIKEVLKNIDPAGLNRKERITFYYDASGNRTTKEVWRDNGTYDGAEQPEEIKTTYYVRDAQGNTMATYDRYFNGSTTSPLFKYELQEQPIYGSERIGQNINKVVLSSSATFSALASPASPINTLSEYENWITTTNKSSLLPTAIDDNLCNCKIKTLTSNSPANTSYSIAAGGVEFLGIANNGIAVAENLTGDLQFYAVLAKKYLGNNDACLIFDKNGHLMKGTETITVPDVNSKPVIVNLTGTNTYAVVTLNATQQPVYHVVDMDAMGYGPVSNAGEVISHDLPVNTNTVIAAKQGYHFTGVEDHINGQSIVYSTRYTPDIIHPNKGTTEILAYDFGNSSTNIPQEHLLYTIPGCGSTEIGELQISPSGDKLAWYQHDKSIAGFKHRLGYIYTIPLTPSRLSVAAAVDIKPASQAGNYGNGMLDFMKNNTDILYSQRGLYAEGNTSTTKFDKNVWQYVPLSTSTLAINPNTVMSPFFGYLFGEIRRGVDGNFYIPNMGDPADKVHSYSGSANTWTTNATDTDPSALAYELASSLPTQVFKIFIDPNQMPAEYHRAIQKKEYELKDHLGNVKMVISDAKLIVSGDNIIDPSDLMIPEVLSYTDYYPFGSQMPGRKINPGSYRYGFNGQEIDIELGEGIYTAEFWEYDSRIGRRWNQDPIISILGSRYSTFHNSPLILVDIKGDCPDCREGTYDIKKGDTYSGLEKKWGMKAGTLASYNPGVDFKKLQVGQKIKVSPTSVSVPDSDRQDIQISSGTAAPPTVTNDDTYLLDPKAEASFSDYVSWAKWGIMATGASIHGVDKDGGPFSEGIAAYKHYRDNSGTEYAVDLARYFMTDYNGLTMKENIESSILEEATKLLPYPGVRDFHTNNLTAGFESSLFPYPKTENWAKAIGGFKFTVIGTITAEMINNQLSYTIEYTIHLADRYNFDKGKKDIGSGTPDAVNGRFAELGWSRAFNQRGSYKGTIIK